MLYLTTRDQADAHTAYKTLINDNAADGGQYVPFSLPCYKQEELETLCSNSFGQIVADILNYFFSAKLSGWDVDCAIGRGAVKIASLTRKTILAESWHNPQGEYSYLEESLYSLICEDRDTGKKLTNWVKIAVKIAVLFGVYAEALRGGLMDGFRFDVALDSGDFSDPMAVFYARRMGLPVGMILCSCDENNALWDLIHRGEAGTAGWSDSLRLGIERLIYAVYGPREANRFAQTCTKGGIYAVDPDAPVMLYEELFCGVVGNARVPAVINSVYRTDHALIDAETAKAYGAVQDYRAKTGENCLTLLFADRDPAKSVKVITEATGLSHDQFFSLCKKS